MKKTTAVLFAFLIVGCGGISIPSRDPGPSQTDVAETAQPDAVSLDHTEAVGPDGADGEGVRPDPGPETGTDSGTDASTDSGEIPCQSDADCAVLTPPGDCFRSACNLKDKTCILVAQPAHVPCVPEDIALPPCHGGECDGKGTCVEALLGDGATCIPEGPRSACETFACKAGACVKSGGSCDDGDPCTVDACDEAKGACKHEPVPKADCDDKNPCTADSCEKGKGCAHAFTTDPCDDGNACTTADTCQAGFCQGGPMLDCDDKNPCTSDACDKVKGCTHGPNDQPCSDGNVCTLVDECKAGICVGGKPLDCDDKNLCTTDSCDPLTGCLHATNTATCSDGNACTDGDQCFEGTCIPGGPLSCDDKNPCTTDACDPAKGCVHTPNDLPCDDGDACTVGETCSLGTCGGGKPLECPGNSKCMVVHCEPAFGCMVDPVPDGLLCEDGNACTTEDQCVQGVCEGVGIKCDDGNPCTDDRCDDPTLGCYTVPNTAPCDDGDVCTVEDRCMDEKCRSGIPVDCSDGNVCTTDFCDAIKGCGHMFNVDPCNDLNPCTAVDGCLDGGCVGSAPVDCNDGNRCTSDFCDPVKGCQYEPNNDPCDDNNACTTNDRCEAAMCKGGMPVNCDDGNPCTTDSCDPKSGCRHENNTAACDDHNACTLGDVCANGACVSGTPAVCDDKNPCTTDACMPAAGCAYTNNTNPCDDGNACTANDACAAGTCKGGPALVCDDGNPCTDDTCDKSNGCVSTNNTAMCDDKNACTLKDTCQGGRCVGGSPPNCDDGNPCTNDACNPASGCTYTNNTVSCDDGNACTSGDACASGACKGTAVTCNDNNPCTSDSCDPAKGCVFKNKPDGTTCDDGNPCTSGDRCVSGKCSGDGLNCDDGNPCTTDSCDAGTQKCVYTNNTAACDDGNACTTQDACSGGKCVGGPPPNCDDGNTCTDDKCSPASGGCVHTSNTAPCEDGNKCTAQDACSGGICKGGSPLSCDDGKVCTTDSCDPAKGCVYANNTLPCDDGNACTMNDGCSGGVCKGGVAKTCDDQNPCTTDSCDPVKGCVFTPNSLPCDDKNACTVGDVCKEGRCTGGSPLNCDDKNVCTTDGCDPASGCVHKSNTLPCDDGNACTTGDTCSETVCKGKTVSCDDGNVCTDDACDPKLGCYYKNNAALCSPSTCSGLLFYKTAYCSNGSCPKVIPSNCDDGNVCTTDKCDSNKGCGHTNNTVSCDDGNACTYKDTCSGGSCSGTAYTCSEPNPDCRGDGTCGCAYNTNWTTCDANRSNHCGSICFGSTCSPICSCGSALFGCTEPNPTCTGGTCKCCLITCITCDTAKYTKCGAQSYPLIGPKCL